MLVREWQHNDPGLEDMQGLQQFIQSKSPLSTIEFSRPFYLLTMMRHFTKIGDILMNFNEHSLDIEVFAFHIDNFEFSIHSKYFERYDVIEPFKLDLVESNKLLVMLFEVKKNSGYITVDISKKEVSISCDFDSGSQFAYEIPLLK